MILDAVNKYFNERIYNVPHNREALSHKLIIESESIDDNVKEYVNELHTTTDLNTFLRALSWFSAYDGGVRKYCSKNYNCTWFKNEKGEWRVPALPEPIQKKLVWSTHGKMIDTILNEFAQNQTLVDDEEEICVDYIHYPWAMKAAAYLYCFPIAIVDASDISTDEVKVISAMNSGSSIIVNLPSSTTLKVITLDGMKGIPDADNSRILTFEKTPTGILKTMLSVEHLSKRVYEKCMAKIDADSDGANALFNTFCIQLSLSSSS